MSTELNETQIVKLHPLPDNEKPLDAAQIKVLVAIADAVVGKMTDTEAEQLVRNKPSATGSVAQVREFAKRQLSDYPGLVDELLYRMTFAVSPANLTKFKLLLRLLSTRPGTLLLAGRATAFPDLPVKDRESILRNWQTSSIPIYRQAYLGFALLSLNTLLKCSDLVGHAIGYPLTDPEVENKERFADDSKKSYPYRFVNVTDNMQLEFDVVIIGSGSGGGVVAHTLSKAGYSVIVLEKAHHYPAEDLTLREGDAQSKFYECEGALVAEDASIVILAGTAFGGGSLINWSASLRPQHYVREEWARKFGLPYFLSDDYRDSLDYVCDRMGVSTKAVKHNALNQVLIDGSRKLGYHVDEIPQNTNGHSHECGYCTFGCKFNEKQGGTVTWLKDAAENGAQFIQDCHVKRVIIKGGKAIGAECEVNGKKLIVKGSKIICSGGSINTPALLLRSKLPNKNVGKNLHLHPCAFVNGVFDKPMYPWKGSIMTAISNARENRDGKHYGAKLEIVSAHPGLLGSVMPWKDSRSHKELLLKYNHCVPMLVICRDRDGGRVIIDENGAPRVEYSLSSYDAASILEGTISACEILLVQGAREITVTHPGVDTYVAKDGHLGFSDPAWQAWIATVRKAGVKSGLGVFGSAHQMASCSMGATPKTSVCDEQGRVWGVKNLYIADASAMPTASGVNPMITTMSIAHTVAKMIVRNDKGTSASARL